MNTEELFTRNKPVRGLLSIKNILTGKIYLLTTENAVNDIKRERFALDLGTHRSKELQDDYAATGLELFTIDLEREAEDGEDLAMLLEDALKEYREKGIILYRP